MKLTNNQITDYGQLAMEIIADYPLYAKTSGITYQEAILLALVFEPDMTKWKQYIKLMQN